MDLIFPMGLLFEFYGNLSDLSVSTNGTYFLPLVGLWDGIFSNQCCSRFGYLTSIKKIHYSLTLNEPDECGSWSEIGYPHNQQYALDTFINTDSYITLVFKPSSNGTISQSIYSNGNLLDEGWLTKNYYNIFIKFAKSLNYIELGRCTMGLPGNWCYSKGLCYTSRLYNKALSSDEVFQNATKTMAYHNALGK